MALYKFRIIIIIIIIILLIVLVEPKNWRGTTKKNISGALRRRCASTFLFVLVPLPLRQSGYNLYLAAPLPQKSWCRPWV